MAETDAVGLTAHFEYENTRMLATVMLPEVLDPGIRSQAVREGVVA